MNRPKAHAAVRGKLKQKKGSLEIAGMNVKLLRGMRGLTQEKLAELAGLKRGQVGEFERGSRGIQLATLDRLAIALDVESWELLRPRDDTGR